MDDAGPRGMPEVALDWHRAGRGAAIATVVETWGSAPRGAGCQLVVAGDGEMAGSVSGGCVEGAVVAEAEAALAGGGPRVVTYGVADEDAFAVGLACGGTIRIMVEPVGGADGIDEGLLAALVEARAARRAVALQTDPATWERTLLDPASDEGVADRMRADRSGSEADGRFIAVHNPPLRMIVVGAVHMAQPLVAMARTCGYDPVIVDPRAAFGSAARFPGERILDLWPDEAVESLAPDARTCVVTLTHDPKLDDPALSAALASPAFYVGSLGSTRTHGKRLERLRAAGLDEAALARIHAPVGLPIGARSPAEIAVSIMGQVTQVLRQG